MNFHDHITPESVQEFMAVAPRMEVAFEQLVSEWTLEDQLEEIVKPLSDDQIVGYILWLAGKVGL